MTFNKDRQSPHHKSQRRMLERNRDILKQNQNKAKHSPDDHNQIIEQIIKIATENPGEPFCTYIETRVENGLTISTVSQITQRESEDAAKLLSYLGTDVQFDLLPMKQTTFMEVINASTRLVKDSSDAIKKGHDERLQAGAKKANSKRVEKFSTIKDNLKQYWQEKIHHTKRATDAATLLQQSDIYINASPQPKRSTLERYIREWQALPE